MVWQNNLYALPLFFAASLSGCLALFMWRRRRFPGAIAFTCFLLLVAEWSLTDGLLYSSADLGSILFWDTATYVGAVSVPVAALIFVLQYTGRDEWLTRRNLLLLSIVPAITLLVRLMNESNHLLYSSYSLVTSYGLLRLQYTFGDWFYVDVAYSYILLMFGIALLAKLISRSQSVLRRQSLILLASLLVPISASLIDVLNVSNYPFDWTPLASNFTGFALFWAVFRFRLLELMPVARETIVRGMADGVIVFDSGNRLVDINPAGEQIFGPAAGIIGKPAAEFFEERGLNGQYLTNGTSKISLNVNGIQRSFDLTFSDLRYKRRGFVGKIGVLRDITDLAASERKYRLLLDNMADIVFTMDLQGNITFATPRSLSITGYSLAELLSMNIKDLIAPEDLPEVMERLDARRNGRTGLLPLQFDLVRPDGTRMPIEIHTTLLTEGDKPVGVQGVARDITERKRMEDALRESERRFREMTDLLPETVFELDMNGRLTFLSQTGVKMIGYDEDDLKKGLSAFQVISPEHHTALKENVKRILNGGPSLGYEYAVIRKDGRRFPAIAYATPMVKEGRTVGLRGVLLDITERKLMEANLLKSKHLAAVGETAAMVGHDLRNPLQGIKGAIYILKTMEDGLSEEGKGMLQMIEDGIQRSNKIIIDLLEYSRELYLEPSPSNAKSLIEQSLASVKIPENIRLVNQTRDQPFIEVDVEKIQRVCVNIMKNAVDAMPEGGTLTVTSRECDDKIELVFADTGEGIRDEILSKIWSPLFTTKAKGMGYGLAIVKRFVEAHGGTVHVQTKLNEGSAFTVSLPIKQKTTALFKPPLEDLAPAGIAWS